MVGSYASLSVCLSHLIKIDISESTVARILTTLSEKSTSANGYGNVAVTGRAHCQRQVAFLSCHVLFLAAVKATSSPLYSSFVM